MEYQKPFFTDRLVEAPFYFANYTPPYTYSYSTCCDSIVQLPQTPPDDILQMQHLRFPTPPLTPPKETAAETRKQSHPEQNLRTESVIMKIGQCHKLRRAVLEIENSEKSHDGEIEYFTTSSDLVCNWTNCKRCFENIESLATHVNKVHTVASVTDGLYYCQWEGCTRVDRGFNARYKMLVHVRTHTKEKPHQCHLCEKCFSRAENLKIHIRSHSGEKPYICTFEGCTKAYSNSSDRFKHTRTHSMEKPYICKVAGCQKRYTDPSSLRKHVKTFKHSEQLMNPPTILPTMSRIADSTSMIGRIPEDDQYYNNNRYYIGMDTDAICQMETESMKYYYMAENTETHTNYWRDHDQNRNESAKFSVDYMIEPDVVKDPELPLDLRINRI